MTKIEGWNIDSILSLNSLSHSMTRRRLLQMDLEYFDLRNINLSELTDADSDNSYQETIENFIISTQILTFD